MTAPRTAMAVPRSSAAAGPPSPRWPSLLRDLVIIAVVSALAAFSAYRSRLHYEQQARISADNLARVLGDRIGGAIEKIDLVLKTVVRDIQEPSAPGEGDIHGLELYLARQQLLLADAKDLLVADADGVFKYGTALPPGFRIEVSDLDYFRRLRDDPEAGLVIGGPYRSRVGQEWVMVFARRMSRPDGSFAGIASAAISAEHFQEMLSTLNLGRRGAALLMTADLNAVARFPLPPGREIPGSRTLPSQLPEALKASPEHGAYIAQSPFDQVERQVAYRRVPGFPLYVVVGLATGDYLSPWWDEILLLAWVAGASILIALWLSHRVRQADLQQEVERALAEEREVRRRLLEQEVAERTADLQAANRQLEGFLYASSHDLKGPLGRISSFSTLLERNYRERLDGDGLLFLGFIRENALRLSRLVDDLLDHARIDRETPRLQPVDLPVAVEAALEKQAGEIRDAGVAVRMEVPAVRVLADRYGLDQVLHNLLENALKYSARMPGPAIDIGGAELGGRFRLWIRDNGIGFDMEYHDRIFEIFRRLHTHAEYAGSGVGLALVKRAMERIGGRVWAESEPGQGAVFYLEFELAAGPED